MGQHFTEKQIQKNYANYEKRASYTMNRTDEEFNVMSFTNVFGTVFLIAVIAGMMRESIVIFASGLIIAAAAGIIAVRYAKSARKKGSELTRIERSEGYSERFFDEINKMVCMKPDINVTAAVAYSFCGNHTAALKRLERVDSGIYAVNPAGGHMYYSALIMALLQNGDFDRAVDAHNAGSYYLNTYKNSPLCGGFVSLSLGIYRFFCGFYEESLQLLDNAESVHTAGAASDNRIPDENLSSIIAYWKAKNLYETGKEESARDCLDYCADFYKTPYYRHLCRELEDQIKKSVNGDDEKCRSVTLK